ncbi:MAG: hypothetical protein EXX96DRAFT_551540 [Benjaminiella poitrasii]|nr:MAG: hypothetical protein EXX96DRAFT_551540 [Benjaminiella poitrasii]
MSINSLCSVNEYKYIDRESVNHPNVDRDSAYSISSIESIEPPSQTKSEFVYRSTNQQDAKTRSFFSEPMNIPTIALTEEELARHNNALPPFSPFQEEIDDDQYEEEEKEEEYVKERNHLSNQGIDDRLARLEENVKKTQQVFQQSKLELEELTNMRKKEDENRLIRNVKRIKRIQNILSGSNCREKSDESLDLIDKQLAIDYLSEIEDICDYHHQKLKSNIIHY